jgi:hypothetical protein
MKKDRRICDIHRRETWDIIVYVILILLLSLIIFDTILLGGDGLGITATLVAMGAVRICSEIRKLREYFVKLENANRAERAGLAMPSLYEDTDDIREAVHEARFKKGPPS